MLVEYRRMFCRSGGRCLKNLSAMLLVVGIRKILLFYALDVILYTISFYIDVLTSISLACLFGNFNINIVIYRKWGEWNI